jgi:hypothetical protein
VYLFYRYLFLLYFLPVPSAFDGQHRLPLGKTAYKSVKFDLEIMEIGLLLKSHHSHNPGQNTDKECFKVWDYLEPIIQRGGCVSMPVV